MRCDKKIFYTTCEECKIEREEYWAREMEPTLIKRTENEWIERK